MSGSAIQGRLLEVTGNFFFLLLNSVLFHVIKQTLYFLFCFLMELIVI
jgi:hypothetical protein